MPPQPKNPARYMPVTMSTRTVVSGGYYEKNRVYPVMTKEVEDVDLQRYTFCKVTKGEPWIFKAAVPGGTGGRRSLFNLKIFEDLEKAASKNSEDSQELEDSQETEGKPPGKKRRKRAVENVHVIQMHETYMDPSVVRNVRLYMTGTKAIWIDVNDVPWLINFVKAEYECQEGCDAPADSTSPALADHGGGIGIEGCSIIWNFEKSQYEAKIDRARHPTLAGSYVVSPSDMDEAKWNKVVGSDSGSFHAATADSLQTATLAYLKQSLSELIGRE